MVLGFFLPLLGPFLQILQFRVPTFFLLVIGFLGHALGFGVLTLGLKLLLHVRHVRAEIMVLGLFLQLLHFRLPTFFLLVVGLLQGHAFGFGVLAVGLQLLLRVRYVV